MKRALSLVLVMVLAIVAVTALPSSSAEEGPIIVSYSPETEVDNGTPDITVTYYAEAGINQGSTVMILDGEDVSEYYELIDQDGTSFTYHVPELLSLDLGNHTVLFHVADVNGAVAEVTWNFTVIEPASEPMLVIDVQELLVNISLVMIIAAVAAAGYYTYLHRFKRFTFRKYFIRNPVKRTNLIIFVPVAVAIVFTLVAMLMVSGQEDPGDFVYEYVVLGALFIGLFPYALYCHLFGNTRTKYEVAFAQFLFELADSIRGGIDPARSLLSFAEVDKGILKKHLKVAADGIRIGRPFDEMIELMVRPIESPMVKRYASLIGETSKMGGDIAIVLHRAAKDMDDLIKIERDRKRQLNAQAMTIYISFAVLLIVIYQLISIYPMMGNIDGSLFGGPNLESAAETATTSAVMDLMTIKQRFLHLMIINSLGAGILIGVFTDGKPKMGLMHALIMTAVSTLFFVLMIIPIG